jgi:hypothetical protein
METRSAVLTAAMNLRERDHICVRRYAAQVGHHADRAYCLLSF